MAADSQPTTRQALEPGLLTAAHLLEWRRSQGLPLDFRPPEAVIVSHQTALLRALAPRFRTRAQRGLSVTLRPLSGTQGRLAVATGLGVGGPAIAILVEELAALGVRRLVAVDIAASLDPILRSGSAILAPQALCGDGTSPHYAVGASRVAADSELAGRLSTALTEAGVKVAPAFVWSTDAPLRETASEVARWRTAGASLVDMETAALYAAGAALGLQTAALLVVADELFDGWRPPADMRLVQATLRRLAAVAKQCLLA